MDHYSAHRAEFAGARGVMRGGWPSALFAKGRHSMLRTAAHSILCHDPDLHNRSGLSLIFSRPPYVGNLRELLVTWY